MIVDRIHYSSMMTRRVRRSNFRSMRASVRLHNPPSHAKSTITHQYVIAIIEIANREFTGGRPVKRLTKIQRIGKDKIIIIETRSDIRL